MPKFYFNPTSETAEGGYYIITDDGSYYDHIGGHSKVHPSNINPAYEITKAEYLAHVPASKVPPEYITNMKIYFVRLYGKLENYIRAGSEDEAIDIAIDLETTRLQENGCEKIFVLDEANAKDIQADND